ncbi:MAG: flagellar hook-basal body complex protein FliE [Phycisphaerales bacterium JB063]
MNDPLGHIQQSQAASPLQSVKLPNASSEIKGPDFVQHLRDNISKVNELQGQAETAIEDLVAGRRDDMESVLMAKQKADIAFQMMLQVRNKLMDAYEEVKQIRV